MRMPRFGHCLGVSALLAALVFSACSTPRASVGVSLVGVSVAAASVQEATAEFRVRLQNESVYPLVVEGGRYRFFLNNVFVGEGSTRRAVGLPEAGAGESVVKVSFATPELSAKVRAMIADGPVTYRIEGWIGSGQLDEEHPVSLKSVGSGTVDLR